MNVTLVQDERGRYTIRINSHVATHNHRVGSSVSRQYPEVRKVANPDTLNVAETMWRGTPTSASCEAMLLQ